MTLEQYMQTYHVPKKSVIHDVASATGLDITLTAGVEVPYPCIPVSRDYQVDNYPLWDEDTSIYKDTIDNSLVFVKFNPILSGQKGNYVAIKIYIPHPTFGNLLVDTITKPFTDNNTDEPMTFATWQYNGDDSDAKTYGFYVTITALTTNAILRSTTIAIAVP